MKEDNSINQEIEDILNSLDGIKRAEASSFFYTRLQARLQQRSPSMVALVLGFLGQPAFALASLSLFVLLNVYAITSVTKGKKQIADSSNNTTASVQTFAEEYDLSVSTLYNDSKNN